MEETEEKPKRRLLLLSGDRTIWAMVVILCCISLIEVFSASSRLTFGKSSFLTPIISHTIHLGMGLGLINFTRQLLARRYNEEDIQKIWGGNFMRVMVQVQNSKQ